MSAPRSRQNARSAGSESASASGSPSRGRITHWSPQTLECHSKPRKAQKRPSVLASAMAACTRGQVARNRSNPRSQ